MKLTFQKAKVVENEGAWLCLLVNEPIAARGFVLSLEDRLYDCEVKPHRNKRSLDANSYFWVLVDKLAEKTGIPKQSIYREAVRNIGGNNDVICVKEKAVEKVCENWSKNGIGWITEVGESKLIGCKNITLYYGSSTYDAKQMSRLIDNIVQDCKAVGIETLTPIELERMKEAWNG